MDFTQRELEAMGRLSPAMRRSIYRQVLRDTSRAAYATVQEFPQEIFDVGMGKSLKKRLKKRVKKVTGSIKRVVGKVEDKTKAVIQKVEDTAKRIASKAPGAEAVSRVAKQVRKQAKRAGGAVQRIAKQAARKAAPAIIIPFPAALAIKSIRKNAAKFYKRHGALIVTAVGAVLAPFTAGVSVAVAAAIVAAKKYYDDRKAAKEAQKAGKAEAAQMAIAVQQQEAALGSQVDQIYSQAQDSFVMIGLTPGKWATLTLEEKMRIVEDLSNGRMPSGYSLPSQAEAEAEAMRQEAMNRELDAVFSQYQSSFESAGVTSAYWYSLTSDEKIAVLNKLARAQESSGAQAQESSGATAPVPSQPVIQQPAAVAPQYKPVTAPAPWAQYEVSDPGRVYPEEDKAAPKEEAKGGFPWLLLAVPAALFIGAKGAA